MEILVFIGIGLAVGIVSGMLGIGGGVLMLPALMWISKLRPGEAAGTTLAVLVMPVVLPAAWEYYIRDNVNVRAALFIGLAFAFGGYGGAWLRNQHMLPEDMLRLGLGLIMVYIAMNMIVMSDSEATKAAAGAVAVVFAWIGYMWLRIVGKRALAKPKLKEQIQRMDEQGFGGSDYHI